MDNMFDSPIGFLKGLCKGIITLCISMFLLMCLLKAMSYVVDIPGVRLDVTALFYFVIADIFTAFFAVCVYAILAIEE